MMTALFGNTLGDAAAWSGLLCPCRSSARSEERRVGKECRYWRDWSSDVCSSDLVVVAIGGADDDRLVRQYTGRCGGLVWLALSLQIEREIGRASGRERV